MSKHKKKHETPVNPYFELADDMVKDVLAQAHGLNHRVDKALKKHGERIYDRALGISAFALPSSQSEAFRSSDMEDRVHAAAYMVGRASMHTLIFEANKTHNWNFSYNANIFTRPDTQELVSPAEWMAGVWTPDYTTRFMAAVNGSPAVAPAALKAANPAQGVARHE